jgi:hypothetical protein
VRSLGYPRDAKKNGFPASSMDESRENSSRNLQENARKQREKNSGFWGKSKKLRENEDENLHEGITMCV